MVKQNTEPTDRLDEFGHAVRCRPLSGSCHLRGWSMDVRSPPDISLFMDHCIVSGFLSMRPKSAQFWQCARSNPAQMVRSAGSYRYAAICLSPHHLWFPELHNESTKLAVASWLLGPHPLSGHQWRPGHCIVCEPHPLLLSGRPPDHN